MNVEQNRALMILSIHSVEHILGFQGRSHILKLKTTFFSEVSVLSDKRSYSNLTFDNVLARQGSSLCNSTRLNFQAFPLRDKMVARKGCRVGQLTKRCLR